MRQTLCVFFVCSELCTWFFEEDTFTGETGGVLFLAVSIADCSLLLTLKIRASSLTPPVWTGTVFPLTDFESSINVHYNYDKCRVLNSKQL